MSRPSPRHPGNQLDQSGRPGGTSGPSTIVGLVVTVAFHDEVIR